MLIRLLIAAFLMVFASVPALAADGSTGYYHVRQEIVSSDGVLVSRPDTMDEDIFDFIQVNQIENLQDYSQWISENLRYQQDGKLDDWSLPQETLQSKRGDCEDFALLTKSVARVLGYQAHFLALVRKNKAHAICVMKKDGYYIWFDNAKLVRTEARTFGEFAEYITTNYQYQEVKEINEETGEWTHLYQKPLKRS